MARDFRNMLVLVGGTVGSRVLGLFRDMLAFGFLGLSGLHSAYAVAFTLPNLFRRLLGEGALSSALVPVFSGIDEEDAKGDNGYEFLNQVVSWVGLLLVVIVGMGIILMWGVGKVGGLEERWYLGLELGMWLLPYMIFVCIAAVLGAVLNVKGRFGMVGMSQVWFNMILIGVMVLVGYFYGGEDWAIVKGMCAGVMLGGLVQMMVPWVMLVRMGWKPRVDFGIGVGMRELWVLFLPGLMGAGVLQVNQVLVKFLAFSVDNAGASVLYLASRLVELPLGVFTVAVVTVVFPKISGLVVRGGRVSEEYGKGMRMILGIMLPAMVGLVLLREPILVLLFEWGSFSVDDVMLVGPVLGVYALGIPFYSMGTFATRGFHAVKDMKTPYRVALVVMVLNVIMSVVLMRSWGVMGLAVSSVLMSVVHGGMLQWLLIKREERYRDAGIFEGMTKVLVGVVMMVLVVKGVMWWVEMKFGVGKLGCIFMVMGGVPMGVGVYYGVLRYLGHTELGRGLAELKGEFRGN